jgi:hypothetical protein
MTALTDRIQKSAEVLGVSAEKITKILDEEGINDSTTGMSILNASTTTIDDLVGILSPLGCSKTLKLKAAASALKEGCDRPKAEAPVVAPQETFVEAMKAMRPIQQWSDRELLEKYIQSRDPEVETELAKRSQNRNFVVLKAGKFEQGKEEIDVENTLELLKTARKRVTPSFLPLGENGTVSPIYAITALNMQDRIVEMCPICGFTLYHGYCEECQNNFAGIGDDERAYARLVVQTGKFASNSSVERKALLASASKGIDDLKVTWPSVSQQFDELKLTNSLPKLRVISSRPNTVVKDPFFMDGNRSVGNRSF